MRNISVAEGGSLTAVATLMARTVAHDCGFGPDALAPRLLWHLPNGRRGPWLWVVLQLFRCAARLQFRLTRTLLSAQMMRAALRLFPNAPVDPVSLLQVCPATVRTGGRPPPFGSAPFRPRHSRFGSPVSSANLWTAEMKVPFPVEMEMGGWEKGLRGGGGGVV